MIRVTTRSGTVYEILEGTIRRTGGNPTYSVGGQGPNDGWNQYTTLSYKVGEPLKVIHGDGTYYVSTPVVSVEEC